jgi:adenylosuccinate synthase
MKASIVVGAGFGDEGKGLVVSFLVSRAFKPLVVRYCGGHQAGHTVVYNGVRHLFSSFGSGTLQGAATYTSRFCTIYPLAILNEYNVLDELGVFPTLYIDPLCPVVTPFDIEQNHLEESKKKHGSVGVGFGTTLRRHEEDHLKLYARDLQNDFILEQKLLAISKHYAYIGTANGQHKELMDEFLQTVYQLRKLPNVFIKQPAKFSYGQVIFEGAQGIMLDQDLGFFPHVTRSNTTSMNALMLIEEMGLEKDPETYYVTRAYTTRHGAGPMPNEDNPVILLNNENETNVSAGWQGDFRTSVLDVDMLQYAIDSDMDLNVLGKKNLVVTCIDQVGELFPVTMDGKLQSMNAGTLAAMMDIDFERVYESRSPEGTKLTYL